MKESFFLLLFFLASIPMQAQSTDWPLQVSYYSPYAKPGVKLGTYFTFREWNDKQKGNLRTLAWSPQIGYWRYGVYGPNMERTASLEMGLDYRRYSSNQKTFGLATLNLAYQLSIVQSEINVDISSGALGYTTEIVNYVVPTASLGFGQAISEKVGYFFKLFGGHRFSIEAEDDFFFGAEIGVTLLFKTGK